MDEEQKPQTINEEAGLGPEWVPIDAPPIIPGSSLADGSSRLLQGSLSPQSQHDISFTGTAYKSDRTPAVSLMPLGVQGNPASNAAIQSTSGQVAQQTVAASPSGGITSVGFTGPKEATITGSPIVPPGGTINWSWATETPGYIFQAPPPGLTGYQGSSYATFLAIGGGGNMIISQTPTTPTSLAILNVIAGVGQGTPAGWTAIGSTQTFWKAITGTSPVSVSFAIGSQVDAEAALNLFNGPAPSFVQSATGNQPSGTATLTNTAGNTLIVSLKGSSFSPASAIAMVISDSLGNVYQQIVNQQFTGKDSGTPIAYQESVWICTNCAGGSNTTSWAMNSGGTVSGPLVSIIEFGPLPAGSSIPFFAPLNGASIPPINLGAYGNGGIGGILPVANGGTGVALSTGTTKVVLSASPTFTGTVALPIVTMSGKVTNYNSIVTVSNGVPAEYATVDLTAQAANIGATNLYAVPVAGAGMYRLSAYVVETTADLATSTLPNVQVVYTDNDTNISVTMDATPIATGAGLGQTGALTANTVGTAASGVIAINVKASTTIQYQTTGYLSGTPGAMKYAVHLKLEAL